MDSWTSLENGLPSRASGHGTPLIKLSATISPCACANSWAVARPSALRSAGQPVNPIKNGLVAGPRYSGSGGAGGKLTAGGGGLGWRAGSKPPPPVHPMSCEMTITNARNERLMLPIIEQLLGFRRIGSSQ